MSASVRRPVVIPSLVRAWRGTDRLQLGMANRRPVVLEGVDAQDVRFLLDLDGRQDRQGCIAHAEYLGLTANRANRLLDLLDQADCLGDAASDATAVARLTPADRDRLAPDLAALSLLQPTRSLGRATFARRQAGRVEVRGAGRLGAAVTTLLAAAGVGLIDVVDDQAVRPSDVAPLGPHPDSIGRARSDAAVAAARSTAPGVRRDSRHAPHLVILAGDAVTDSSTADHLFSQGVPHLPVTVLESTATVGPVVMPGLGPCLRCLDLQRTDRDPAWPLLASQVGTPGPSIRRQVEACDVVLATTAAGLACLMGLALLEGRGGPEIDPPGTSYVLRLPGGRPRRRHYSIHPRCGCGWGDA